MSANDNTTATVDGRDGWAAMVFLLDWLGVVALLLFA